MHFYVKVLLLFFFIKMSACSISSGNPEPFLWGRTLPDPTSPHVSVFGHNLLSSPFAPK